MCSISAGCSAKVFFSDFTGQSRATRGSYIVHNIIYRTTACVYRRDQWLRTNKNVNLYAILANGNVTDVLRSQFERVYSNWFFFFCFFFCPLSSLFWPVGYFSSLPITDVTVWHCCRTSPRHGVTYLLNCSVYIYEYRYANDRLFFPTEFSIVQDVCRHSIVYRTHTRVILLYNIYILDIRGFVYFDFRVWRLDVTGP